MPYDPELAPGLERYRALVDRTPLTPGTIPQRRAEVAASIPPIEIQQAGRRVRRVERTIPGPAGAPPLAVTVISPRRHAEAAPAPRPAVLGLHGGGMLFGTRYAATLQLIDLAEAFGAVGVAVEYRLAPEHPAPAALEDCYAALRWLAEHAADLGADPGRIVVAGTSAGGGLAAGVALLSRDRGGPQVAGQMLNAPMLDDRNATVSARQFDGIGVWDRNDNDVAWDAVLGRRRGTAAAGQYVVPARADELSGLPPAYIEVGSADLFRDEAVTYAGRIWAAGGAAELHVWPGGYHGFTGFSRRARLSRDAVAARHAWLRRLWSL